MENHIKAYAEKNYRKLFREPAGQLNYQFIVPGGSYTGALTYKELSCLISGVEGALKLADAVQNG